ncbi:MAG TPA: ATP-binding protein, partial [Polyangiaceae bacterium]
PGAIQPHGVFFSCKSDDLRIKNVSANVATFFGAKAEDLLGKPVTDLFDDKSKKHLVDLLALEDLRIANPSRVVAKDGKSWDAVAHRNGDSFVVELEPATEGPREAIVGTFDPRLRASIRRLQNAHDVAKLTKVAAEEVRLLTGFDRVMVYRFDADWNGEVVAEAKRDDLEAFLGQHYPASDIPAQARRLYTTNWLRFIADASYVPSPIVPTLDPDTKAPLDLSASTLRSVSPIHIEYLHHMGVTASMSISLVIDGQLAGLIACHHYSGPRIVPVGVRDTAEYLGYALSWQLRIVEGADRAERTRVVQQFEAEVVRSMAVSGELIDGLDTPALLGLADAAGAAIVLEEGVRRIGETPDVEVVRKIVDWLKGAGPDVFATHHLSKDIPAATEWEDKAGGVVAVAIARELGEYILWFRPAIARVIKWAGNPHEKPVKQEEGKAPRLTPRGSFDLWRETVKGRSLPWEPWQIEAASSLRRVILGGVRRRAVQLRSINKRLLDADRAKDDFIATVSHELRTPLNAITGWTSLLKSGGVEADRIGHALDVIARNVQTQLTLVEDLLDVSRITSGKLTLEIDVVDVANIVANAIETSALAIAAKGIELQRELDLSVSHVRGDALRLKQVVSNLLTNAVKFTPKGGAIKVRLEQVKSDVEIVVQDTGQGIEPDFLPHVFETFRQQDAGMNRRSQGLGLGLAIVNKLVELHGGRVTVESDGPGKGATFRVRLPVTPFLVGNDEEPKGPISLIAPKPQPKNELAGLRIFVVEDDNDSRDLIRHILERNGAEVTSAADATAALAQLSDDGYDVIVSDVGLPDIDGFEFMRKLRSRPAEKAKRTPAIALTAYTRAMDRTSAMQAGFNAHMPKPVDPNELVATILSVVGRVGG